MSGFTFKDGVIGEVVVVDDDDKKLEVEGLNEFVGLAVRCEEDGVCPK